VLSASSSIGNSRYALTNYPSALLEYQSQQQHWQCADDRNGKQEDNPTDDLSPHRIYH
jgi:hypothetical protein